MKSWRAQLPLILSACLFSMQGASACIWDSHTIQDELASQDADIFQLISNQFPEHGEAYYKHRVEKSLELLRKDPGNSVARNDLGAAYTKLGEYDKALAVFTSLDKAKPNTYETLSNLGVLHKKMGKFDKAADYIARALKIKPEGHMGLGDWYLRMLRYKSEVSKSKAPPEKNFLGATYGFDGESFYVISGLKSQFGDVPFLEQQAKALIRNDRHFADGYVLLGDVVAARGANQAQMNLAFWCYVRAHDLGHKNPKMLTLRMKKIHKHWRDAVNNNGGGKYVVSFEETLDEVRGQLKERESWLNQFKRVEAELIEKGQDVDFRVVKAELANRRIYPEGPENAGIKSKGFVERTFGTSKADSELISTLILIVSALFALGILYIALRVSRSTTRSEDMSGKLAGKA